MEINRPTLKQNWTTSVLREEAANFNAFGNRQAPNYITESETQREYRNPFMELIGQNRYGRYVYTPDRNPPKGIVPTCNAKSYPDVIPRFRLYQTSF
ncbi:unnamed protein product [Adineta ricciae]|uniref:Uncharacterized protein n=1 Tax=Adineta ricciae TaxID=249248 RepID=A0A813YU69_ADIRI|nr:unnamed protein product [Adineta ricciae]CAF1529579.1 unnamed protein product [Adineta ricciae]